MGMGNRYASSNDIPSFIRDCSAVKNIRAQQKQERAKMISTKVQAEK
jgi:hypothetical protein